MSCPIGTSFVRVCSMGLLLGGGQVGTTSAEGDGQAAVDDPDAMNFRVYEIGKESIQREDERGRLFVPDELRRELAAHHREEKFWDGNAAECRRAVQRHAHFARSRNNLPNLHFEWHADELANRADDAHQPVFKSQFQSLDRIDAKLLRESVQLPAVDTHFQLIPFDETLHSAECRVPSAEASEKL